MKLSYDAMFYLLQIAAIALIVIYLLTHKRLRQRDTVDAKRICNIAIMVAICAVLDIINEIYCYKVYEIKDDNELLWFAISTVFIYIAREMIALHVVISWNLYVDYSVYKSDDHVSKKHKKFLLPCIILAVGFALVNIRRQFFSSFAGGVLIVMTMFLYLCVFLQFLYVANAIWILWSVRKERKPPTFLRLDFFIIPLVVGYVLSYIWVFGTNEYRSFGLAIAIVLTWHTIEVREKYMDSKTGFYNKNFLSSMNHYMETRGFPNGTGIYFKAPGSEGRLVSVLESVKPADAEIFVLGEDEYLLMAESQKQSVIRLLIKSVELAADDADSGLTVISGYGIREKDESVEAFTERLLKLSEAAP